MTKKERQSRILKLVRENDIDRQEDICRLLNEQGLNVTQATISRDVKELRLKKVPNGNRSQKYARVLRGNDSHLEEKYIRVLKDAFLSMDNAQNILVIRTVAGMAMAVAAAIDALEIKSVVGSIAGDDTIMMAIRSTEEVEDVMNKIGEII